MTTISSLNNVSYLNASSSNAASSVASSNKAAQNSGAPQSSTIVKIGGANQSNPAQIYSLSDMQANPVSWQTQPDDAISSVMAGNYLSQSLTGQFKGLGSALLNFFKTGGSNFSQSVTQGFSVSAPGETGGTTAINAGVTINSLAANKLTIKTKSGVEVNISLESQGTGLAVKVTSNGDLGDAERNALAKLSGAFQDAIDGLSAKPPHLNLGGLTQFDTSVLSSVDLHSDVTPLGQATQTIDFHADSASRTVSVDGPAGKVKVSVDLSDFTNWGNQKQRTDAVNNYLKQFGQAAARGQGDPDLMAMFKDAFTEMNSDYGVSTTMQRPAVPLNDSDHAMLTGLADFDASVTQKVNASNPMHQNELDTFSYQVSQDSSINGNAIDRSISQHQKSHLIASYHTGLVPDIPLELSTEKSSQNYRYTQIDDVASSTVSALYRGGDLIKASLSQSASQSTHNSTYQLGVLTEDTTTPFNASLTKNILDTLKPLMHKGQPQTQSERYQWEAALSGIHDSILLEADPAGMRGIGA